MSQCDYCCSRWPSITINCSKCNSTRKMFICWKCCLNVEELIKHSDDHPNSIYQSIDIPLDDQSKSCWKSNDELELIETIESCGLGNWSDLSMKISKNSNELEKHFEDVFLSRKTSHFSLFFRTFQQRKTLIGEDLINRSNEDFQCSSLIYPLMLINNDQQKSLTYMPHRDEYEREYLNECEQHLPNQIQTEDQQLNEFHSDRTEQDQQKTLLNRAKLLLLRSYGQVLRRRFKLKDFIRDYGLAHSFSTDQTFDLHQISRFISADQYERLIFNHRKIEQLLNEVGCRPSNVEDQLNRFDENRNKIDSNKTSNQSTTNKRRVSQRSEIEQNRSINRERRSRSSRTTSSLIDEDHQSTRSESTNEDRTSTEKKTRRFVRRLVSTSSSSSSSIDQSTLTPSSLSSIEIDRDNIDQRSSNSSLNSNEKSSNDQIDKQRFIKRDSTTINNQLPTSEESKINDEEEQNSLQSSSAFEKKIKYSRRSKRNRVKQRKSKNKFNVEQLEEEEEEEEEDNETIDKFERTNKISRMLTRQQLTTIQSRTSNGKRKRIQSNEFEE